MGSAQVVNLPPLLSTGSSVTTAGIGHLHDANCITVYLSTGTNVLSSLVTVEVSQYDPADGDWDAQQFTHQRGAVLSSAWYPILIGSSFTLSSGLIAITVSPVGFRGLRLRTSTNSIAAGTIIAYATKQLWE
jgi:hypothetical protein